MAMECYSLAGHSCVPCPLLQLRVVSVSPDVCGLSGDGDFLQKNYGRFVQRRENGYCMGVSKTGTEGRSWRLKPSYKQEMVDTERLLYLGRDHTVFDFNLPFSLILLKPSRTLWGLLSTEAFLCPPFLVCRE